MISPLFNEKTLQRKISEIKLSNDQKKSAEEWLKLLEQGELTIEKEGYIKFASIILNKILGYDLVETNHEKGRIDFSFDKIDGRKLGIEVKGSKKKLEEKQLGYREGQETPVNQLWNYMGKLNLNWGIATNYQEFILIGDAKKLSAQHKFNFLDIKEDKEKLKDEIDKTDDKINKMVYDLYGLSEEEIRVVEGEA